MEGQSLEGIKNQINQETINQNQPKARGRPRKDNQNQPKPLLLNQSSQQTHHQHNPNANQTFNVNNGELVPAFKSLYEFGDDIIADHYKDDVLKSSPAQVDFLAKNSNDVVFDFFPSINSKYIKLIMFLITLVAVYGKKWIIIKNKEADKKKSENAKASPEQKATQNTPNPDIKTELYPVNPKKLF